MHYLYCVFHGWCFADCERRGRLGVLLTKVHYFWCWNSHVRRSFGWYTSPALASLKTGHLIKIVSLISTEGSVHLFDSSVAFWSFIGRNGTLEISREHSGEFAQWVTLGTKQYTHSPILLTQNINQSHRCIWCRRGQRCFTDRIRRGSYLLVSSAGLDTSPPCIHPIGRVVIQLCALIFFKRMLGSAPGVGTFFYYPLPDPLQLCRPGSGFPG